MGWGVVRCGVVMGWDWMGCGAVRCGALVRHRVQVVPVAMLPEHAGIPWTIKARVLDKSNMIQWNEQTHFFTIDLQDAQVWSQSHCSRPFLLVLVIVWAFGCFSWCVYADFVVRCAHRVIPSVLCSSTK